MENALIKFLFLVFTFSLTLASPCCEPGYYLNEKNVCISHVYNETEPVPLSCTDMAMIVDKKDVDFLVNTAGKLELLLPNRIVTYEPEQFCVGLAKLKGHEHLRRVALICSAQKRRVLGEDVYGWCMLVSACFLYYTAGWYSRSQKRDLLGKSMINLCVSLAMGLSILSAMKLVPYSNMKLCAARGFFTYFFVLVSFFWMNVVSYQILYERKRGPLDTASQKRHYVCYAAYAWGFPTLLTIMMAVNNFMPGNHLKPGIGLNHCWFFDVGQQWQYMYSVMSVLLVVNLSIFTAVTISVCCHGGGGGATHQSFKHKFGTCIRLLFVMGIPWVFEMIDSLTPQNLFWEIIDLFNALQGIWIFIVLVLLRPKDHQEESSNYNQNISIATVGTTELPYVKLSK